MSNKNFGKRKKSQSFRPSGGMKNKPPRTLAEKGREDMENGRLLDGPVYDSSHEAEILKAENKAAGIKEEKPVMEPQPEVDPKPKEKENEKGIIAGVKRMIRKLLPKKPSGKEIIINAESLETRVAIIDKTQLEDFTIERNNV